MGRALGILGAALALLWPAAADAATWRGETAQGRPVSVMTGGDGMVSRVRLSWRARCGPDREYTTATMLLPPFGLAGADAFADSGTYRTVDAGGYHARIAISVAARRAPSGWSGTLDAHVLVARRGTVVDRCVLRRLRWSARPVG